MLGAAFLGAFPLGVVLFGFWGRGLPCGVSRGAQRRFLDDCGALFLVVTTL